METRVCPIPKALVSYTSAPSSPARTTTLSAYFFSVPTSPSRSLSRNPSSSAHESDHFRFGSLVYENGYDQQHTPMMAYADELFYGGRLLPLKLPPRLQSGRSRNWNNGGRMVSSTSSSPASTGFKLNFPFMRRSSSNRASSSSSSWMNDEFDPFATALEKVKETDSLQCCHLPRRSRSLSPLKWGWGLPRSKSMRSEKARLSPTIEAGMGLGKPAVEARRQRIKKLLLKSASFGWKTSNSSSAGKKECRAGLLTTRRAGTTTARNGNNAVMRISRGLKSLVKHRPSLLFRIPNLKL